MMMEMRQTHLEYYQQQGIAPVCYDLSCMDAHLERRESLYAMLGLLPLTFRGAKILEVAAGTGHNSLYVAAQLPEVYVLLEPNPIAVKHIYDTYSKFDRPHTQPEILMKPLEDYYTNNLYDIVICENWLGTSEHELSLLIKLADLLAPKGILVITVVSPIGFVPNLLRRYFVPYLTTKDQTFEQRSQRLEKTFGPHLATLSAMTRNITDWVQDNMLNPAYFGLCLNAPRVISRLGTFFEIIGAYPAFVEDWRWFKALYGQNKNRNEHFLKEYWLKCHNFIDYRAVAFPSDPVRNQKLEDGAFTLLSAIANHEDAHIYKGNIKRAIYDVASTLKIVIDTIPEELIEARLAMDEVLPCIANPSSLSIELIGGLKAFGALFGRETSYLSLMRR